MPPVPAAGVPASVAVPLPLSVKVTPLGSVPARVMEVAAGEVVTVKVPALPTVKVVFAKLVNCGGLAGGVLTVRTNAWAGEEPAAFDAVNVMLYDPPVPTPGVPDRVPVPLPLSVNDTPEGNAAPPREIDGTGNPVAVTVKLPAIPTVKVAAAALVTAGT